MMKLMCFFAAKETFGRVLQATLARASADEQKAVEAERATRGWCHSPDEPRPDHFPYSKGRREILWIVPRDRTTYEVWFRTQGEIEAAKRRAEATKPKSISRRK